MEPTTTIRRTQSAGQRISAEYQARSANGRAVGLNTPPAMFADGTVGPGGPYDAIVTLNSARPFQFSRPVNANSFDGQRMALAARDR